MEPAETEPAAAEPAAGSDQSGSGKQLHRQGFYLGMGAGSLDLDHNLDIRSSLVTEDIKLDSPSNSTLFVFGYGSGRRFTTEGRAAYSRLENNIPETDIHLLMANMDFHITVTRLGPLETYGAMGFGVLLLSINSETVKDFDTFAVVGDFGAGLVTHLSRRFSLSTDYRYSILNFEKESKDDFESGSSYDVGGTGFLHSFTVQVTFDF